MFAPFLAASAAVLALGVGTATALDDWQFVRPYGLNETLCHEDGRLRVENGLAAAYDCRYVPGSRPRYELWLLVIPPAAPSPPAAS
ncbi:hypothetical protein WEH80_38515 [Actinomycetes bacterium KLBMP 9759]